MNAVTRWLPLVVIPLAGIYLLACMQVSYEPPGEMQLAEFAKLPVVDRGRVKPIDTVARNTLMAVSNKQTFSDKDGNAQPAIRWLLDAMTSRLPVPGLTEKFNVFVIKDDKLLALLKLEPRPDHQFRLKDLIPHLEDLIKEVDRVMRTEPGQFTEFDQAVYLLYRDLQFYHQLERVEMAEGTPPLAHLAPVVRRLPSEGPGLTHKVFRIENDQVLNMLELKPRPGWYRYSLEELEPKMELIQDKATRAIKLDAKQRDVTDEKMIELAERLQLYVNLAQLGRRPSDKSDREPPPLLVVPTTKPDKWLSLGDCFEESEVAEQRRNPRRENPFAQRFTGILLAYARGDARDFNSELAAYQTMLDQQVPGRMESTSFETSFNHLEPFYRCSVLYVWVFGLVCMSWLLAMLPLKNVAFWRDMPALLNWSAFWLVALIFVVHSLSLIARMWIQGRPPVTNLYSSAVFIGWGAVLLGMIVEFIFRIGIGNAISAICGFATLLIAHYLASGGDTLEMMQAVLDTNFWLATHVTCITFGYAATFVAGIVGILFVILGVFTPLLDRNWFKILSQIIYGIICFAMFLSFTGTVLGGLWADWSWGRFWGWDPKENGALLIVIWNALILHARWGGVVKQRGVAVLAIVGNMVTGWSWFGTNQLGIGLHAYGFNNTLAIGLRYFWMANLLLIFIGLIPTRYWLSFIAQQREVPQPKVKPTLRPGLVEG